MQRYPKFLLLAAAVNGVLAVGLGAFGAHGLAELLAETGRAATWDTASLYQLVHSPAVLAMAIGSQLLRRPRMGETAAVCWLVGTLIFSGSLYCLALGAPNWFGAITPIGGLFLIAGWLIIAGTGGIASSSLISGKIS